MLALLIAAAPHGWVTTAQASFGASLDDIRAQLRGEEVPGLNVQAELSALWSHNPTGLIGGYQGRKLVVSGAPYESLRGLGGGITWSFDSALCGRLLPQFSEDAIISVGPFANLVDCQGIHVAVARAFEKWGHNNRNLQFIDMTEECTRLNLNREGFVGLYQENLTLVGNAGNEELNLRKRQTNSEFSEYHGGCPLAEIWVTHMRNRGTTISGGRRLAEADRHDPPRLPLRPGDHGVINHGVGLQFDDAGRRLQGLGGDMSVATAHTYWRISENFYYTTGERPKTIGPNGTALYGRRFVEGYAGRLDIAVDGNSAEGVPICWYLDSNFCSFFHRFKRSLQSPATARVLVTGVTWIIAGAAALFMIWHYKHIVNACFFNENRHGDALDKDGDGSIDLKERYWAVMDEIAHWNPLLFAILVTCVCGFPVMLYAIVLPCWECADFEAAILHEAGHFLGLSHPDYVPNNLVADVSTYNPAPNPSNTYQEELANGVRLYESGSCSVLSLWEGTREGTPPNVSTEAVSTPGVHWGSQRVRNSVMEAFTQHNPSPCLYDDDVEALNVLYPDCSPVMISTNTCYKVQHNIGLVRVMMYLIVPTAITLFIIIAFSSVVAEYQKAALRQAEEKNRAASKRARDLEKRAREADASLERTRQRNIAQRLRDAARKKQEQDQNEASLAAARQEAADARSEAHAAKREASHHRKVAFRASNRCDAGGSDDDNFDDLPPAARLAARAKSRQREKTRSVTRASPKTPTPKRGWRGSKEPPPPINDEGFSSPEISGVTVSTEVSATPKRSPVKSICRFVTRRGSATHSPRADANNLSSAV